MSKGQDTQNATLTGQLKPTSRDVDLLHRIVLRAQNDPRASDKESLLVAYNAVFCEEGIDVPGDRVGLYLSLLFKILDSQGNTLYDKFESVLSKEGIVLAFDEDRSTRSLSQHSNRSSTSLPTGMGTSSRPRSASHTTEYRTNTAASSPITNGTEAFGRVRRSQSASSVRYTELKHYVVIQEVLDRQLDHPPPYVSRLMQTAVAMDRRTLLKSVLTQLDSRHLVAMESTADRLYEYKLKFKVVTHWRNVAKQLNLNWNYAGEHYVRAKELQSVRKMFDTARVNRLQAMEEERLRGMSLYKMTIASRESFFHRNMDTKLKRRYLLIMTNALRATSTHQHELDGTLQRLRVQSDLRTLQLVMNKIFDISRTMRNIETSADGHYMSKTAAKAAKWWSSKVHFTSEMMEAADDARKYFLMRKYWFKMRDAAQARRNRRTILGKWVLSRWRNFVSERKHDHYDAAYKVMRRKVKMNLARRCLRNMTTKSTDIKALERMAEERNEQTTRRCAHRTVVVWYDQSQQAKQLEDMALQHSNGLTLKRATVMLTQKRLQVNQLVRVADQFQDLHTQGVATTCLKAMGRKLFEVRRRQQDADDSRVRHDRHTVRSQLDQWRRKAAENRGEGPLILPPATPAQRRADQLNRLASTTPQFAPRMSFAARLRGEVREDAHVEEEQDGDERSEERGEEHGEEEYRDEG